MFLNACKTIQVNGENSQIHVASSVRRDSIYLHDSVLVRMHADTVYLEKWHTRWRERETVRTDTVQTEVRRIEKVEVRYVPAFYKCCAAIVILIALYAMARVALFVVKRVY